MTDPFAGAQVAFRPGADSSSGTPGAGNASVRHRPGAPWRRGGTSDAKRGPPRIGSRELTTAAPAERGVLWRTGMVVDSIPVRLNRCQVRRSGAVGHRGLVVAADATRSSSPRGAPGSRRTRSPVVLILLRVESGPRTRNRQLPAASGARTRLDQGHGAGVAVHRDLSGRSGSGGSPPRCRAPPGCRTRGPRWSCGSAARRRR